MPPHGTLSEIPDCLAPDGSEIRLTGEFERGSVCDCRLPPGGVSQAVRHRQVEEIWLCLEGAGEVWRQDPDGAAHVVSIGPGSWLAIPVGTHFQFRNTGADTLRIVIATMPRWPGPDEAVFVENHWPRASG